MKVGSILPLFGGDPARVLAAARESESLGFDGVFVFDHFFPPGAPPDRPALEGFTTLAAVAAATDRVSVGLLVTRASLRPAGLIAKMAAQVDHVSGGRVILGIGTGDPIDEPEHRAFGFRTLDVRERRAYLEEAIRAIKALFRGEPWAGGDWVPAIEGPLLPPPVQQGGPRVWVGAQADAVVRIAAANADGWNGWGMPPERFAAKVAALREEAERDGREVVPTWAGIVLVGRDDEETARLRAAREARGMDDVAWVGSVGALRSFLLELGEAGAEWVILVPAGPRDRNRLIGTEVLPHLR